MLRSIQKLIGDKRKQLIFPIFLMSLDAIGSLVMYLMLYFTVIHLLNGSLTGGLVRNYTIVCLISIILRLIIYRSGYFLCFSRGAEMCSGLRLDLANHYRSLSLGYFNQNSSGYLLSTLTKELSNFELVLTHTLPSIVKTLVMGCLILVGTFFINWKLALAECVVILIALPVLNWGNRLVEKYGTIKRDLTSKMISIVLEYIKGMKVFKSANMTSTHFTRMSDTLEDIRKTSVQAEVKTAAPTSKCKNYPLGNTDRNHNILNCICRRMDWTFFRKSVRKPGRNIRRCDFNFNRGTDFYYGLTEKNWRNLRNEKIK